VVLAPGDRREARAEAVGFLFEAYRDVTTPAGKGLPHAQAVADLLRDAAYPVSVQIAGFLHDVVEDTPRTVDDVRRDFGDAVAEMVDQLTEDDGIRDYERRKLALREQLRVAGPPVLDIALADKIATLQHAALTGTRVRRRKLAHYRATLELGIALKANPAFCRRVDELINQVSSGVPGR
jgi:(p)ppGpp synthase/HD superfamily hydrolase